MNIPGLQSQLKKANTIIDEVEAVQKELKRELTADDKRIMNDYLDHARMELRKISNSVPEFISEKKKKPYKVDLDNYEKRVYLTEMGIENSTLRDVRKKIEKIRKSDIEKKGFEIYKRPGLFSRSASSLFSSIAIRIAKGEIFQSINSSLRKANMPYLISTYISIAILASIISFFISAAITIPLYMFVGAWAIFAPILIPLVTFFGILLYPMTELSSIKSKIEDELPFAVMHMAAIASSGVEPTRVFSILASSPEYPTVRKEMRKVVNMINFYGYDLTTALKISAKTTSSAKLSELFNGMAATISGGGDLRNYLDKIAADSLTDYKFRRKRFITVSETYADIYTGLLIAAPLMFMLILVLMNVVTGNVGGLSSTSISLIGIGAIVLMNIGFLIFLEVSQPSS